MQTNDKNELLSTTAISSDDSFAGFVDTYEGEDEIVNQRMIQGTRIKFSNEGKWTDNQGIELDPGKHYARRSKRLYWRRGSRFPTSIK